MRWTVLHSGDGRVHARSAPDAGPFRPTAEEWRHLEGNHALVASRAGPGVFDRIFLAKRVPGEAADRTILSGEIDPAYLFGGKDFLPAYTELAVLTRSRRVLFSSLPEKVPLRELERAMSLSSESGSMQWEIDGDPYAAYYWTLFMRPTYGDSWIILLSMRNNDILEPVNSFKRLFVLVTLLSLWTVAFLSIQQIRRSTAPIEQLRDGTRRIATRDFGARVCIRTRDELEELGESFNDMAERLGAHVATMETVNGIGKSLTAERQEAQLLRTILRGVKRLTQADGGALYLLSDDQQFQLAILEIDSLGLRVENEDGLPAEARLPLLGSARMEPCAAAKGRSLPALDLCASSGIEEGGRSEFDRRTGYQTRSSLSVPLRNHENEPIGVLQLVNATDSHNASVRRFSDEDVRLAESLASQAAIALIKNRLVEEFRQLFEGLTRLIAAAVDAKSTYTAGHSQRVQVLTMMIAEAACKTAEGPLRDFTLSDDELYELNIAARLHDCGKVATPVHIADKATKLEAIVDRMELIKTRLEILRRDRQIELLKERLQGFTDAAPGGWLSEVEDQTEQFARQLRQEVEFLCDCNRGGESMSEASRRRVLEIAERYHWFDADNKRQGLLRVDEVENLTIVRGTLNEAERRIINEHVGLTFRMLNALPYPRKLKNVPLHAGAHHERMDGRGYPFGLKRELIPMQGRMIGMADVFEALTSKDRPYKRSKTLSEALQIMQSMKEDGHIDPDLYDVFMKERIYMRYALEYLDPGQIDDLTFLEAPLPEAAEDRVV